MRDLRNRRSDNPAGIYVHIPFCERLCPYCDFAVSIKVEIPHREYAEAVIVELRRRREELDGFSVATLYFGGGTPSLLAPRWLERIVDEVDALFGPGEGMEVTMEANPNQLTGENLARWKGLGIERLSIGCQSFQDRHLRALRRNHDGEQAYEGVVRALGVMDRVSMDLMFAGPSQTMEEWEADLEAMQRLVSDHGLDHVSAYNLTIEPGTAFAIRQRRGTVKVPDHETAAAMLERLVEACQEVGLRRYEVSNFSVPRGESEHNSSYWRGRPYLGVGVGAHSLRVFEDGAALRRANPRRYDRYMESPGEPAEIEDLSPEDHLAERLFLGARSRFGIDMEELRERFGQSVGAELFEHIEGVLDDLVERGWMERAGAVIRPTNRGLDFSDSLAQWLFEAAVE